MPKVSVIIPCFNHGHYLLETINSIIQHPDKELYEIIIVNDGSTDEATIKILKEQEINGYNIIHQKNQGSSAARNTGIKAAKAEYILPVDSDNRIRHNYMDKAIEILDKNHEIAVVYGNSCFFGEEEKENKVPDFCIRKLIAYNYIDTCAVFRKKVWKDVGGFDSEMPLMGYEDWEFWLAVASKKWGFYHINEVLFEYRVSSTSQVCNAKNNRDVLLRYTYEKHAEMINREFHNMLNELNTLKKSNKALLHYLKKNIFNIR